MSTDDPMMAGMAGRYAAALFELAKEEKQLETIEADVKSLQAMLAASADLRRLVQSPVFAAADQARALGAVLGKAGICPLLTNFLLFIASKRRLFAVGDMLKGFARLLARERGEVNADVATAFALNEQQMLALADTLKAAIGKGVQISTHVDPNLLGGLIVKVGSRMIDSSLRTKLNTLKVAMKGIV